VLALALVGSLSMMAGAALDHWGRTYGEAWAYRAALRVQPWRLTATERLAELLAIQARSGDPQAGEQARARISDAVAARPWDPDVRFFAFAVDRLLGDEAGASAWSQGQARRFPGDPKDFRTAPGVTSAVPPVSTAAQADSAVACVCRPRA
jgi:hypothetical protein